MKLTSWNLKQTGVCFGMWILQNVSPISLNKVCRRVRPGTASTVKYQHCYHIKTDKANLPLPLPTPSRPPHTHPPCLCPALQARGPNWLCGSLVYLWKGFIKIASGISVPVVKVSASVKTSCVNQTQSVQHCQRCPGSGLRLGLFWDLGEKNRWIIGWHHRIGVGGVAVTFQIMGDFVVA